MARVVRIMADVELAASRLVACRGGGILAHQRQEGVDLLRIDLEIDNNHIHRIPLCQAAPVIWSMTAAVTALVPMSPPNPIGRRVFAAKAKSNRMAWLPVLTCKRLSDDSLSGRPEKNEDSRVI